MAIIRAYTTIEQSRKLAEILPIESADMYYQYVLPRSSKIKHNPEIGNPINALEWYNKGYVFSNKEPITMNEFCIPCWSLAALLGVLTKNKICHYDDRYYCQYMSEGDEFPIYSTAEYDNPVDACVDMIEKLNELKML